MKQKKDIFVIGFALFATVFGAGNLLFPPVLGIHSGTYWWLAVSGFIISDALFAFLTLYLFSRFGSLQAFGAKIGQKFMTVYGTIVMMIFAFFILPRTASMTYELSVQPFVSQEFNSWYFYILYFVVALFFTISKTKVFETLGFYLAPIFGLTIFAVIVGGIISIPTNYVPINSITSVFGHGFVSGYQTADLLGSLFISSFAVSILHNKGYSTVKERGYILLRSGIVCLTIFVVLYFGLAYVGAKIGSSVSADISPTQALGYIASTTLGESGSIALAFVVFITCFTTTIGALGMVSNFMAEHLIKRVNYSKWVILFTTTSVVIAHKGVDFIIQVAGPVLLCVYPVMICLVIMQLCHVEKPQVIRTTCYVALFFSFIDALASLKITWAVSILEFVPFGKAGFVWFLPTLITYAIAYFVPFATMNKIEKRV